MVLFQYDKVNKFIIIPDTQTEVTIQDLINDIRDWEDEFFSFDVASIANCYGKQNLGGETRVGLTLELLGGWRVQFQARLGPSWTICNVSGGNLVALDELGQSIFPLASSAFVNATLTSSSSATLQESTSIEYSSYNGGVTVDINSSYSGTVYPVGTPRQPVNNLIDALFIANSRGFTKFYIMTSMTIGAGRNYINFIFIGENPNKTNLILEDNAQVEDCEFSEATISGVLDGGSTIANCRVGNITYMDGIITDSILLANTEIHLSGTEFANIINCSSGRLDSISDVPPTIDMGAAGTSLAVRNYNGTLRIINKTGPENIDVDLNSGLVILDTSVINGTIQIRGIGELINNSTATVDDCGLLSKDTISRAVLREPVADHKSIDGSLANVVDKTNKNAGLIPGLV